ncbi:hypothetical protein K2173_002411 [Erythroxylum novogranatense]|uniref:Zinc finger CCCH domain-containing protein 19-like n=1 Tax=Erythroxylum novogranatense TaxID=1862640 RepID=A0AAV8TA13_9ROSI|nr:hypothetical protein K2173_002411 [Erythroxylum novogranatense]
MDAEEDENSKPLDPQSQPVIGPPDPNCDSELRPLSVSHESGTVAEDGNCDQSPPFLEKLGVVAGEGSDGLRVGVIGGQSSQSPVAETGGDGIARDGEIKEGNLRAEMSEQAVNEEIETETAAVAELGDSGKANVVEGMKEACEGEGIETRVEALVTDGNVDRQDEGVGVGDGFQMRAVEAEVAGATLKIEDQHPEKEEEARNTTVAEVSVATDETVGIEDEESKMENETRVSVVAEVSGAVGETGGIEEEDPKGEGKTGETTMEGVPGGTEETVEIVEERPKTEEERQGAMVAEVSDAIGEMGRMEEEDPKKEEEAQAIAAEVSHATEEAGGIEEDHKEEKEMRVGVLAEVSCSTEETVGRINEDPEEEKEMQFATGAEVSGAAEDMKHEDIEMGEGSGVKLKADVMDETERTVIADGTETVEKICLTEKRNRVDVDCCREGNMKKEFKEENVQSKEMAGKIVVEEQTEVDTNQHNVELLDEMEDDAGDAAEQVQFTEIGVEAEEDAKKMEMDKDEEMELDAVGEEMEMQEEAGKANEVEETEMAEGTEGAEDETEEIGQSAGRKRKRGKSTKIPTRVPSRRKSGEDVCFICFDGGSLVLCDRRGCPKAYHPACVNRDDAFFQSKGKWNCGWHLCSSCGKNAYYMCYTCTFSLCKGCIKDAVIFCVRGNKGFCETCMKTVLLIEGNGQGNEEMGHVNFDDKNSWEYLFKDYLIDLKARFSLTSEEIAHAKNPWKGPEINMGMQDSPDEVYNIHNDKGSGSDSSANMEVTAPKRRRGRKRMNSRSREGNLPNSATGSGAEGVTSDERILWASKELLEFVGHMRNGDKSVCSQFDVQALLLEYIKRNKLRDPRRKSQIICDSRLQSLFGKPRVGHFEMLKLLESHFLWKEDSQVDDQQGSVVDTEANQLDADGNYDTPAKSTKDKKRKSRKKGGGRGLQSNLDDYAAINMHNISLIYLKRSLVENLIEDMETFHDKVVGAFVRIRISGSAQKQDLYRLVQVVGTSKAPEPYRVGKKTAIFQLEILNLSKTEVVTIDIISNQDFTEDECKRLRQSIRCGLLNRLTVGDIQEKAMALQAVRVEDALETEITRLSHLRDRASDLGRRKELRECVEKLQLLKSPQERHRRLEEIPEIHADPKMDPSYESEEDGENDDKGQENYVRPRSSSFSRRGQEPISPRKGGFTMNDSLAGVRGQESISPRKGGFTTNDSWTGVRGQEPISPRKGGFTTNESWAGTRNYMSINRDLNRSMSNKGFLSRVEDAVGTDEIVNDHQWNQGREREANLLENWEKQKTSPNSEAYSAHSVLKPESAPQIMPSTSPAPPSGSTQSISRTSETEKIWHYKDPSGKIQGPFSMVQLRKWSITGYFPSDLRIWRTKEKQDDSILLTEALSGNIQKEPPSVDNSLLKTQLVQNLHPSSLFSANSGENLKPQSESTNSMVLVAPTLLNVPNNATDRWASDTNLPSPTPAQAHSGKKGQAYESKWSPTQAKSPTYLSEANRFSAGRNELHHHAVVSSDNVQLSHNGTPLTSSTKSSGHVEIRDHVDGTNISHTISSVPKPEAGMHLGNANVSQMHSQSTVTGESPGLQLNSHMLPTAVSSSSVSATIDMKSLHSLVQPVNGNIPAGSQGWMSGILANSGMNSSSAVPGNGSQAWEASSSQKLDPINSIPMPTQPSAYGNWRDAPASLHNSASSLTPGNHTAASVIPGTSNLVLSDAWKNSALRQSNLQPAAPPLNVPWGMNMTDNQSPTPRQGTDNQNTGWGPVPGNPNVAWGGPVPANSNHGWVAPAHVPGPGNANQGWVAPRQGQGSGSANLGWTAPIQGQAPGNSFPGWAPPGQVPAPVSVNAGWVAPGQVSRSGNANPGWAAPSGNLSGWATEQNQSGDRLSSQRERSSQGSDSSHGSKPWNRQPSFSRGGESSRPSFKGQRVCKFHENGHCKKGAACDYLHN